MGLSASVEGANDLCWVPPSWPKVPYLPGIFATAVSDQRGRALTCNALLGWRGHSSRASLMVATVHCGPDPVPPLKHVRIVGELPVLSCLVSREMS